MKQEIMDLNQAEHEWVANSLAQVKGLVESAIGKDATDWLRPALLDKAYKVWNAGHRRGEEDPNSWINAFGIAFGKWLSQELDLEWKLVSDELGTELAIFGMPGKILLFPPNLVAKRYVDGQTEFFLPLSQAIVKDVKQIREQLGR
jgi:hypothetical protein